MNFDGHAAEALIKFSQAEQGPPAVEVDFQRLPHGHPADDGETFADDGLPVGGGGGEKGGGELAGTEEQEADQQGGTAFTHEALEITQRHFGAIRKVVGDGISDELPCIGDIGGMFRQMHDELQVMFVRVLLRPAHNEFLGIVVQILSLIHIYSL